MLYKPDEDIARLTLHPKEKEKRNTLAYVRNAAYVAIAGLLASHGCEKVFGKQKVEIGVVESRHEVAHLNHLYDGNGRHVFDQVIVERLREDGKTVIDAWKLCINKPDRIPVKNQETGKWEAIWHDNFLVPDPDYDDSVRGGVPNIPIRLIRKTTFDHFRETWSQQDPEVEERSKRKKEDFRFDPNIHRPNYPNPYLLRKTQNR